MAAPSSDGFCAQIFSGDHVVVAAGRRRVPRHAGQRECLHCAGQAEGIGHAFLEAMAEGMVVVANDAPTHSEYISHGLNGLLFSNRAALDIGLSSEMGNLAWQTHAAWPGGMAQADSFSPAVPEGD